jgi:hypothetical protein
MRRTALQTFFRGALVAAIPFGFGVAQATTPACTTTTIVTPMGDDGGAPPMPVNGAYSTADCNRICGGYGYWCEPAAADAGLPGDVACHISRCAGAMCGRLTDGVDDPAGAHDCAAHGVGAHDVVAFHFATAAALEAASVLSFRRLARELAAHGAPSSLVARALASARDEVRHARIVGQLAEEHGGRRRGIARTTLPLRALDDVAVENAVEGCVRETFGALVASWQGMAAATPSLRATMRAVGRDEERHAELAWDIARWAEPRLSPAARRRLARARRAAVAALERELAVETPEPLVRVAGLPTRAVAQKLFAEARRHVWAA